jgi:multiple sugar transport system permease protein
MKRERRFVLFSLLPALAVLISITVFPFFYLIYLSMHSWNIAKPGSFHFNNFGNFVALFSDPRFLNAILRTLNYVGAAVVVEFGIAFGLASFLSKKFWGKKVILPLLIIPLGVTPIVASLVWKILYHSEYGLINYFIELLGLIPPMWLTDKNIALYSIIIIDVWRWTPLIMLIFIAGITALPKDVYEAAELDGARGWQRFKNITWPLLLPISSVVILMRLMDAFKAFDDIYGLTQGGPGTSTETMNILLMLTSFRYYDFGKGSAISLVMLVLVTGLCTMFVRLFKLRIGENLY